MGPTWECSKVQTHLGYAETATESKNKSSKERQVRCNLCFSFPTYSFSSILVRHSYQFPDNLSGPGMLAAIQCLYKRLR